MMLYNLSVAVQFNQAFRMTHSLSSSIIAMSRAQEIRDALGRMHRRFRFDARSWAHAQTSMDILITELDIGVVIAMSRQLHYALELAGYQSTWRKLG